MLNHEASCALLPAPIAALVLALSVWTVGARAQTDSDGDGLPDALEEELLTQFAPVWRANDNQQRPPLPVDWYVAHCQLRWYTSEYNGSSNPGQLVGTSGNTPLSVHYLASYAYNAQYYYRLHLVDFYEDGMQYEPKRGEDPRDWISWANLQEQQRGVYGRVAPLSGGVVSGCGELPQYPGCDNEILVQYYMFFGYNISDHPDERVGPCGAYGNHEGDVACVEFEIGRTAGGGYSISRAVYHNHSREIFVDSPASLYYEEGHPIVFLERETNEAVPWPGTCGLRTGHFVPPCVGTNETYHPIHIPVPPFGTWEFGGECDDFQVVREHQGVHFGVSQPGLLVTQIVNLGEKGMPGASIEAQFLDRFPGLLGDEAYDQGCFCYAFGNYCFEVEPDVGSPKTPQHQDRLWCRARHNQSRDNEFPGFRETRSEVFVDFGYSGVGDGTLTNPIRTLRSALGGVSSGGMIVLLGGQSPELVTLCKPMTITAVGGSVTIGQ